MATGYTSILVDNDDVTFNEFAWRCARACGAFIMQRDDSLDAAPVLERKPDTEYYDKQLAEAKRRLDRANTMTVSEAKKCAAEEHERVTKVYRDIEENRRKEARKYEAMMAEVEAWTPPTKEHVEMKKFMLDQLRSSIEFDCRHDKTTVKKKSAAEWLVGETASAQRDVEYYSKQIAEEIERTRERNAWTKALVLSIGLPPSKEK